MLREGLDIHQARMRNLAGLSPDYARENETPDREELDPNTGLPPGQHLYGYVNGRPVSCEAIENAPLGPVGPEAGLGSCPECSKCFGMMNIGREHWGYCDDHKTKWHVGSNLFSSWRVQNEETWKSTAEYLAGYRDVTAAVCTTGVTADKETDTAGDSSIPF